MEVDSVLNENELLILKTGSPNQLIELLSDVSLTKYEMKLVMIRILEMINEK
jgi:hypothetical protein